MRKKTFQVESLFGPEFEEHELLAIAVALGAEEVSGWSDVDVALVRELSIPDVRIVRRFRDEIAQGQDPLGEAFAVLRPREVRRLSGATYTPRPIVRAMVNWCSSLEAPGRVIDPGCGSGRFLLEAGERFPRAGLIGIEIDPVAAVLARGNLSARGWAGRSEVRLTDFRELSMPRIGNPSLFIGNPPYVRHHLIAQRWKKWLTRSAAKLGVPASQLAGLHVHFFLATVLLGSPGDYGIYITAAEWLDVNYGELLRRLAVRQLGVRDITLIEPTAQPFPDAATTAAIASFTLGRKPESIGFRRISSTAALKRLPDAKAVSIERLENESRWTVFTRSAERTPKGYIELGELCRVHRGQVTGANDVWVVGADAALPSSLLFPTVTRAKELFQAGAMLSDASRLRRVVDLPVDLEELDSTDRRRVNAFLVIARAKGADTGYVAEKRKAWWSVGLRAPAPVLCTYMARRPPAFVENGVGARHINIAHGLYPRETMSKSLLRRLIKFLATSVSVNLGRTYAGGLTKFEPGEIERIPVPQPEMLAQLPL